MIIRPTSENRIVVLLGAGASRDAGLPLVAELTQPLYQSIISASGRRGPDVHEFIQVAQMSRPEVAWNYETLFQMVLDEYSLPYYGVRTAIGSRPHLRDVPHFFPGRAAICMAEVLGGWPRGDASYLRHLAALAPLAPIRVFTLNYDTLVEEACSTAGSPVVTGFDDGGRWNPEVFERSTEGVVLYKLHGSLSWFEYPRGALTGVVEARDLSLDPSLNATKKPAIVLGPIKTPEDSPPAWREIRNQLLERYHDEITRAAVCVVIGFGWADGHVVREIVRAHVRGMVIVEVSPTDTGRSILGHGARYVHVPLGAQAALEAGLVAATVRSLRS